MVALLPAERMEAGPQVQMPNPTQSLEPCCETTAEDWADETDLTQINNKQQSCNCLQQNNNHIIRDSTKARNENKRA